MLYVRILIYIVEESLTVASVTLVERTEDYRFRIGHVLGYGKTFVFK
jgi:hypothetical protein